MWPQFADIRTANLGHGSVDVFRKNVEWHSRANGAEGADTEGK